MKTTSVSENLVRDERAEPVSRSRFGDEEAAIAAAGSALFRRYQLWGALLLLACGAVTMATNPAYSFFDDEALIVAAAGRSVQQTLALFASGTGQHEHPPLFDLLFHFWLRATGGPIHLLRVPSIVFFLLGLWWLALCAREAGGRNAFGACLLIGVLWPFGFQYGRLAGWYSFSFFLVALITYHYLRLLADGGSARWWKISVAGIALVYTSYLALPMLACLGFDYVLRKRRERIEWKPLVLTAGGCTLAFLPLAPTFLEVAKAAMPAVASDGGTGVQHAVLSILMQAAVNFGYSCYALGVGESVAPWFWPLSVPLILAIGVCVPWAVARISGTPRRIFAYGVIVLAGMSLLGVDRDTARVMIVAPWLILPLAVGVSSDRPGWGRVWLLGSLIVVACGAWTGIVTRQYYALPDYFDDWPTVVSELRAGPLARGEIVVSADAKLYLHLNRAYGLQRFESGSAYLGADEYLRRGLHLQQVDVWAGSTPFAASGTIVTVGRWPYRPEPERWKNARCTFRRALFVQADTVPELKRCYYPATRQEPRPLEIREYACAPAQE